MNNVKRQMSDRAFSRCGVGVLALATALVVQTVPVVVLAQQPTQQTAKTPIIYPAKGQSAELQEKDKNECYSWSTQQTGYDPVKAIQEQQAQQAQAQQAQQQAQQQAAAQSQNVGGERAGGAVKGAAAGAVVGAIAGDTGKGAAIGAATGVMAGGRRQRGKKQAVEQQQQASQQQASQQQGQQQAAANQKYADYMRAWQACMEGRSYTIK